MQKYPGSVHCHTDYSNIRLRDSINKMPDLINYAIELGHSCIGITDHECLSSFVDVENYVDSLKKKAQKNNEEFSFKVIRGNEIFLSRNGLHEAYLNSQDGDREVKSFYEFTYLMSSEEISYYFKYLSPEQLEYAFKNIEEIANKCQEYSIKKPLKIPQLPWLEHQKFSQEIKDSYIKLMPTLKEFENSEYAGDKELVNAIIEGIQKHSDNQNEKAYAALEECLQLTWVSSQVNKAHWSAYYLNLQKIIEECWNAGSIIGPARGSGGGFLLLYCLDIIQMNCLR